MIGKMVEVTWMDATGEMKVNRDTVDNILPSELLEETKTYGILQSQDLEAVLIYTEISKNECDYTCIPKGMIKKITILKGGNKK